MKKKCINCGCTPDKLYPNSKTTMRPKPDLKDRRKFCLRCWYKERNRVNKKNKP